MSGLPTNSAERLRRTRGAWPFSAGVMTGILICGLVVTLVWLLRPVPSPTSPSTSSEFPPQRPTAVTPEALERLKSATVYLEVDDGFGGGGTGTGWFGGEPGLIVTNAHNLGMLHPGTREPAKITLFVNPGDRDRQRRYEGHKVKILAVDRDMDLALLQLVNELDLPPPLPVRSASELHELEDLVCLGFPGGRRLAERNRSTLPPAVSVTRSAVSAFRRDDGGRVYSVQLQGGVAHGHSGGPVCDPAGNVVGVAVRVDLDHYGRMTGIGYAVPVEYVTELLAGRAVDVEAGQGYLDGDRVVYPISVTCADGLQRLKAVGVGVWLGETSDLPRTGGDEHRDSPGDTGYREIPLRYDSRAAVATGQVDFPKDTAGRACWIQPYYSNATHPKRYLPGRPLPISSPPVERVPIALGLKYPAGETYHLTVTHEQTLSRKTDRDESEGLRMKQTVVLNEQVGRPKAPAYHAELQWQLVPNGLVIDVKRPAEQGGWPPELVHAYYAIGAWSGGASVSAAGDWSETRSTPADPNLDPVRRSAATRLGAQLAASTADSVVPLPGARVTVGEQWTRTTPRRLIIQPEQLLADPPGSDSSRSVSEERTYTYLGRRDRGGRGEVVLRLNGTLRANGEECGILSGRLVLEETTGLLVDGVIDRQFRLPGSVVGAERVTIGRKK